MSIEPEPGPVLDPSPAREVAPVLQRETIVPSSDRGRLAAIVATCSLAGLAGGMALSMLAETHRVVQQTRDATRSRAPITWLGVGIRDGAAAGCAGARVLEVTPASPAARAGVRDHDLIVGFGADRVCDADHLIEVVRGSSIGETSSVRVRRGAQELVLRPTLGVMPDHIRRRIAR
jgi:S1-C subfamily serine protease